MRHSMTPEPTPFTFEKLPCAKRVRVVATLAAACAFSRLNQTAYGLWPLRSLYSRTSIIHNSNTCVTIVNTLVVRRCQADGESGRTCQLAGAANDFQRRRAAQGRSG